MSSTSTRPLHRLAHVALLGVSLTLAACADDDPTANEPAQDAVTFRRIAVGDNTAPSLRLFNAADFSLAQTLSTPAPVSYLYTSGSSRLAIYHVRTQNQVGIVDGGVFLQNGRGVRRDATLLGTYRDSLPTHGNVNGSMFTVHFDGSGQVAFWNENSLSAGNTAPTVMVGTGGAHHGAAVAKGNGQWLLTSAHNPSGTLPRGINVRNMSGAMVDSARNCPDLHGLAANATAAVYGCADGALMVEVGSNGRPAFSKLTFADDTRFGVGTVWGWNDKPLFLVRMTIRGQPVSAATRRMGIVDPATRTLRGLTLPNNDIDVTGDLDDAGTRALVIGRSGTLYIFDGRTQQLLGQLANVVATVPATGALSHQLTAAEGRVYITNPTAGEIVEVNISAPATPTIVRRHAVGGQPVRIALLGVRAAAPVRPAN
jgi:hypothetical protein